MALARLSPVIALCVLFHFPVVAPSSNILAVIPTVSKSHFDFFQPLLLALASRGHNITVVSCFPQAHPVRNYFDIDLKEYRAILFNNFAFSSLPHIPTNFFQSLGFLLSQIPENTMVFSHPGVRRLLDSSQHFDLILAEQWNTDLLLGFAHRFQAPVVAMSSCEILPWGNARFGNPDNPSYISNVFLTKKGNLNFLERFYNALEVFSSKLAYAYLFDTQSEVLAKQVYNGSLPPLDQLAQQTSLLLVNTHHTLHGSRPFSPQVIQVGGIHVRDPKPLQLDLDKWMNESVHGVIYFSFGSMLRGATLPGDKVQAFLQVFKSLPQRVLWKWEDDGIEGLPENVKIMKWLPQRDVLAHPKVKLFISHGGLLGTTEAVVSGVPILGIPMYGDQPNNVAALVENGVAIHVDYNNISVESLSYALNALINDARYRENAAQLSRRFLDRPMSPLDTAVYWTEYVIRHRGAPHLRSAAVSLTWYQYYLLDVAAVCLATLLIVFAVLYFTLRTCFRMFFQSNPPTKLKSN